MKLKVVKLGHGVTSFVALVKTPEFYCQSHALDAILNVKDPIGHALMAAYPGVYEVMSYGTDGPSAKPAAASRDKMAPESVPAG